MGKWIKNLTKIGKFLTNSHDKPGFSKSREISTRSAREIIKISAKDSNFSVKTKLPENEKKTSPKPINPLNPSKDKAVKLKKTKTQEAKSQKTVDQAAEKKEKVAIESESPEELPDKPATLEINPSMIGESKLAEACPYCASKNFVRRGTRKNKYQVVQLYICKNPGCEKTFTAQDVKGKHFPLNLIIESMSYYNLGFTLEDSCRIIKQKFGIQPEPATLSQWIDQYKPLCRYERLRPFAIKMFKPQDIVEVVTMAHRQLYRFRYHRAKTALMLQEFRNYRLSPLKEYLDNVSSTTPHQYFQEGERMSEIRSKFDKAEMIVKSKHNYANRLAAFVLQAVQDNQQRHEAVQRFMLANDSVTVATEVPVYIRKEDVEYMENNLQFKITDHSDEEKEEAKKKSTKRSIKKDSVGTITIKGSKDPQPFPKLLTGHIDLVQIRNGQVHLLDFKPKAAKEKPVEQLTWYALAMSRLTGLKLFDFKCGWFDENDYFEFYPLHVVKKIRSKRKRKVHYRSGLVVDIPKDNILTIVK